MVKKLQRLIFSLAAAICLLMPLAFTSQAIAASSCPTPVAGAPDICNNACKGTDLSVDKGTDCSKTDKSVGTANNLITNVVNIFSVIVGIVAVIMIIVGGFRYITSGGQSEKITSAKNTILYALVGLIIVALAQVIVRFVLNKATQS